MLRIFRFLTVRENLLRRITVEELKATPKIVGLDISNNPLECDDEFKESVQWLTDHGVNPIETLRYLPVFKIKYIRFQTFIIYTLHVFRISVPRVQDELLADLNEEIDRFRGVKISFSYKSTNYLPIVSVHKK